MKALGTARLVLLVTTSAILAAGCCDALSRNPSHTRRDFLWKAPLGAVGTYAYGRLVYNALSVQGIQYPAAHEDRVAATLQTALLMAGSTISTSSSSSSNTSDTRPYRILEVGIGKDCRVARRGLYQSGLQTLMEQNPQIPNVEITGVDLQLPNESTLRQAQRTLSSNLADINDFVELKVQTGDITTRLDSFPDGYFDSIVCCLTLCSVADPNASLLELQRLLRPNGGTLAYVEHVAVEPGDQKRSFLELQQIWLDPLQQRVADNCHLHRNTDESIRSVFGITSGVENDRMGASTETESNEVDKTPSARLLESERFFVDSMWPVSCQCRGVVQRMG